MLKQIAKRHMSAGLHSALRNLFLELKVAQIHRNGVRRARALRNRSDLKLNLGCGPDIKPGYVNIDLGDKADLRLDLREPLPFSGNSCSMVQSEHFLEHLSYPGDAMRFLAECFRVLRPGGIFRVGVPDSEWPIRAYARDPYYIEWFDYVRRIYPNSDWNSTDIECVNYSFHQGNEHKFGYDFDTLKRNLAMVGFSDIERVDFDPSLDYEGSRYALDTDPSKCTTLYVTARK
jgi:predicted SAM-dependent methyltransferase